NELNAAKSRCATIFIQDVNEMQIEDQCQSLQSIVQLKMTCWSHLN
ncbi:20066_t:CDS:1, partial [Racocetra persica]